MTQANSGLPNPYNVPQHIISHPNYLSSISERIAAADHARLIQVGNRAYIELYEMYVGTKAELDALRSVIK